MHPRCGLGLRLAFTLSGLILTAAAVRADVPLPKTVEFNRDIRPILADNCFACHGPDKNQRKAELHFDTADGGIARVIVPGKPAESELYQRVSAQGKRRMPPAKFVKRPTPRQVALLRLWIEQGGKYQSHWSLIPPKRPEVPKVADAHRPRNAIDHFILHRLDVEGLKPSPEADRRTLIRRLSFDLTGLPLTPQEVDAFLADKSPDAYEKLVDRLLASKHFGERMALYWLDLVRFADTGGYHSDNHRDITLYRDYVIKAFNDNKPFDRFTVEQLAGDLLPNPTTEQKIASGYNRLLMTTEEGGAQAKEYTAKYQADRVRNASTVWLGLTLGCCECHSHKFDPFTQKEFYQFAAFFADLKERAVGRQEQVALPTAEQEAELRKLDEQLAGLRKELAGPHPGLAAGMAKWEAGLRLPELRKLPKPLLDALLTDPAKRTEAQKRAVEDRYRTIAPELEPVRRKLAETQRQKDALMKQVPTTLISIAVPPRVVRVLPRGNWLDESGEIVQPGVPASLSPLGVQGRRATRLDLAHWLTAADHPLTSRVFVNRLWKLFFGQGIVRTMDDFGSQGRWPTHPDLLDWLAVEFMSGASGGVDPRRGWDVKHMVKLMVTSATYRQVSTVGEELRHRDPYNELLARQARFRLDAEMVRDNALAISGLLSRKIGGPSVKPYQPAGYWALLNFPRRDYMPDRGEDQHRRGLYTYWQRTFPHPSLVAFDAPSREECTVERPRSNTPLQALVLLNDPTYVEAARAFAERIVREGGPETAGRIHFAFRQALARPARPEEMKLLEALHAQHRKQYQADKAAAEALLKVGERPAPKDVDPAELAAWMSVARVVLNLHETITRN